MTITASDIILLFIGLLITGAVGGLTYFLKTQFEKIVDKAGAQSEHDANRVISEIQEAAREDANRGIQKLTETRSTREVAMNDAEDGERDDDAWKHVNQEHITENSVQHEKMMHIMELVEKNHGAELRRRPHRYSLRNETAE